VTAANALGSATWTGLPSSKIKGAPVNTVPPSITGTPTQGQTLSRSTGTWLGFPSPSLTTQWRRCDSAGAGCADIVGATASTYTLVSDDVGSTIVVGVTGKNNVGTSTAFSAPTAVVSGP
jgi:hypothetical protein